MTPLHVDARSLPFAGGFFDAIVCVDSYPYYGTDDLYLNYLAHFVKPGGQMGIAGAGLVREMDGPVAPHLKELWTQDFWALHSAAWWRRLWERTGIVDIEKADAMPDGWRLWLDWQTTAHPENRTEITASVTAVDQAAKPMMDSLRTGCPSVPPAQTPAS